MPGSGTVKEKPGKNNPVQVVLETKVSTLETENKRLKMIVEQYQRDLDSLRQKEDKSSRMERGLHLIRQWAEDQSEQFLLDLLDLIED